MLWLNTKLDGHCRIFVMVREPIATVWQYAILAMRYCGMALLWHCAIVALRYCGNALFWQRANCAARCVVRGPPKLAPYSTMSRPVHLAQCHNAARSLTAARINRCDCGLRMFVKDYKQL